MKYKLKCSLNLIQTVILFKNIFSFLSKGDINSDRVYIRKAAGVEGAIKPKTLSIKEGSVLKIKAEKKNKWKNYLYTCFCL